ncbi:MAG: hypothetical protein KTR28_09420 [Micavibrio sp.]|nr:hypothetical protein [Micavibrio sp.]
MAFIELAYMPSEKPETVSSVHALGSILAFEKYPKLVKAVERAAAAVHFYNMQFAP